jgi:hypothetical protein
MGAGIGNGRRIDSTRAHSKRSPGSRGGSIALTFLP